ncbi:MAG: DUF4320 family protein [Clostridiales bacterium]
MKIPIKSTKGEGYIDAVFLILIFVLLIVLVLNILSVFSVKNKLDHFAVELAREVEIVGDVSTTNSQIATKVEALRTNLNINPDIEVLGNTIPNNGTKIQIDTPFTVVCTTPYTLGGGGFDLFTIDLAGTATGRSEQYWKP